MSSLDHLAQHHGSFADFRDAMVASSEGRFNDVWWGIWNQYAASNQPRRILDLGTGPGLLLPKLRERHPEAKITGVEVQPEMLKTARQVAKECGAELMEADLAEPLSMPAESVDVITAVMVLHELLYPPTILTEAVRLLKPGGRMIVYDWVKRPLEDYVGNEEITPSILEHFKEHCLFGAADLCYLAERAGLRVIECIGRRSGKFAVIVLEKPEPS